MSISSRIHDTIEAWQLEWKDRLLGWLKNWISEGIIQFIEAIEPEGLEFVDEGLAQMADAPGTPDVIKNLIARIRAGGKPIPLLLLIPIGILFLFPMITALFQPLGKIVTYGQERIFRSGRMDPQTAIRATWRGFMTDEKMRDTLTDHGFDEEDIETLLNVSKFYPGPQDLVTWQAREVFEPAMVTKYGLLDEVGNIEREPFYKAGMTDEQIDNYWKAHWLHASWIQIVEMLHRGLVTEDDVYEWFKVVEIVPHWRRLLIETAYTWPTRVDVRRWWDMRTIDETELRRLYSGMGYRGVNLDNYVLWTKVYTAFPDLMSRWSNGWITLEDVRAELVALGMPAERVEEFVQIKVKAGQSERTATDRQITITDIYKGVKQDKITRGEAVELLIDLGFDEDEAVYKLDVNIPEDEVESVTAARQLTKSEIIAGLRTGVLTRAEARDKLLERRYSATDAELLLTIFEATIKPPAEEKQRQASKADIVLAVKKELVTPEEGYLMLLDLNFTPEAAEFILLVKAESSPFSPVTFGEFKDLTSKWRKAAGMTTPAFNDKLREAGAELVKISDQVKVLQDAVRTEELLLVDADAIPEEAEKRLKDLRVALNRAKSEKERLQSAYNTLVAEFRQTEV